MITIERLNALPGSGVSIKKYRIRSDQDGLDEELFFAVPSRFENFLADNDKGIIPLIGVMALIRSEDAHFSAIEADPLLVQNVTSGLRQLQQWHTGLRVPQFTSLRHTEVRRTEKNSGVAAFLSGGVDSVFTLAGC